MHLLFADQMADRWTRLRNRGPLFENRTPIDAMIEGGIPMMLEVRRHVDELASETSAVHANRTTRPWRVTGATAKSKRFLMFPKI